MRAYFFGNMYLSSIQQGIQAAHAVADMFIKYSDENGPNFHTLREWAADHKTMVLLNGGFSSSIAELCQLFDSNENPFPWAPFYEEEAALNGALTTVGIILPEYIYIGAKQIKNGWVEEGQILSRGYVEWDVPSHEKHPVTRWEFELMCQLNNYGLAK